MKPLIGRMRDIALGRTDLPQFTVNKYLTRWKEQGYEIPVGFTEVKSKTGTKLKSIITRETGITSCALCLQEVERLDEMDVDQILLEKQSIVDKIMERGRHQLKWWEPKGFAIRFAPWEVRRMVESWIDEAIK